MKTEVIPMTISQLIELDNKNKLRVDDEYQRAGVWSLDQKQRFIDSILRGLPIPMLILFKNELGGYDIIDGQQRQMSICDYYKGKTKKNEKSEVIVDFKLLDVTDPINKFPLYLRAFECQWAKSNYHNLAEELKAQFSEYLLPICIISDACKDELRDIFIRLQSGSPLSSQEKRDAMPGEFCKYIIEIAGKGSENGIDFFESTIKETSRNRGKMRQLAAQISMLFFELETNARIIDIGSKNIDNVYYEYLSMEAIIPLKERLLEVYEDLYNVFGEKITRRLENHEAIHLVLFAKECKNLNLQDWQGKIYDAFHQFRENLQLARNDNSSPFWTEYLHKTRVGSDNSKSINERQSFFNKKMLSFMYGGMDNINRDTIDIKIGTYHENHPLYDQYLKISNSIDWDDKGRENLLILFCPDNLEVDTLNQETVEAIAKINIKIDELKRFSEVNPTISKILIKEIKKLENEIIRLRSQDSPVITIDRSNQVIYRLTRIRAIRSNGTFVSANSFAQLIPTLYPEYNDGVSRNYPGLILGTDRITPIFEDFWQEFEMVEFLMNGRLKTVRRRDFGDFWPNRFANRNQ